MSGVIFFMNFELSSDDLTCINNALCAKVDELHRCYLRHYNADNKSEYAAVLYEREQRYHAVYMKLNGGYL